MKFHFFQYYSICLGLCLSSFLNISEAQNCLPVNNTSGIKGGKVVVSYGAGTNIRNSKRRMNFVVGQHASGNASSIEYDVAFGYFSSFFLPPQAPNVNATQGELLDRIQVQWQPDPLSPQASDGYNIYKDGIFLATVGPKITTYIDYNVIAGIPYTYTIKGLNDFGEGPGGSGLGFIVPNGVVTGHVESLNGSPVPDALITLTPMQGFSSHFEATQGAVALKSDTISFLPNGNWSLSFWMKTDTAFSNGGIIKLGQHFMIKSINSNSGSNGIILTTPNINFTFPFPDSTKNDWHHLVFTRDAANNVGRVYVDGKIVHQMLSNITQNADTLYLGNLVSPGWKGNIDELRIYNALITDLDLPDVMNGTASKSTPNLSYYWKMDEELGVKSFDLLQRTTLFLCNAEFSHDIPPVHTSARTNQEGYYIIDGVSYGTGTTFIAEPSKDFYLHKALKFVKSQSDYATLPDFTLPTKSTIELWINNANNSQTQELLNKTWNGNEFKIQLRRTGLDNRIEVIVNGNNQIFGNLGEGYQHLAFTIDSVSGQIAAYKNGVLLNALIFPRIASQPDSINLWYVGGKTINFFDGLIDEIAVYDTLLSPTEILAHFNNSRDMDDPRLYVYYPFDEGNGANLNNVGYRFLSGGITYGTEWSAYAPNQVVTPHVFSPATRQVTLNPSVTSVDRIDFTDRSTVAVSGYVRFQNTSCFQEAVEILVNGSSYNPRIFTDSEGKFTIDFDPGTTAVLSPVYQGHTFVPSTWTVTNVTSPIAGILFNNNVQRKISGNVAGGDCMRSIIKDPGLPSGTVCTVKIATANGCYEKQQTIANVTSGFDDGAYEFLEIPPFEKVTVAIVEHSDPEIKSAFQARGGSSLNLSLNDTIVHFIYHSQPQIDVVSGLEPVNVNCDAIVMEQGSSRTIELKLYEPYLDGVCFIDTGSFHIINTLNEEIKDTTLSNGLLQYSFIVGGPNPSAPYTKSIQFVASTIDGNDTEKAFQVLITGFRARDAGFVTQMPVLPFMILRDPPGDGSYAYIEKDSTFCRSISMGTLDEKGAGGKFVFESVPDTKVSLPGFPSLEFESVVGPEIVATGTKTKINETTAQVCITTSSRIATSDEDLVVQNQGGDVFIGTGINVIFALADYISFDTLLCEGVDSSATIFDIPGFHTNFIYSEWYIRNTLLYQLDILKQNALVANQDTTQYQNDIDAWNSFLSYNDSLEIAAQHIKNISFDAGVEYEIRETISNEYFSHNDTINTVEEEFESRHEFYVQGVGGGLNVVSHFSQVSNGSIDTSIVDNFTTGYVLKDDDVLDAFSVDICYDSIYMTPVFKVVSGQSSCPWEPGTAKREGVNLLSLDGPTRIDVPADQPATYRFLMQNTSATKETWTYAFTAGPESNPHSAKIFCNGAPMNQIQWYAIPWGETIPVTVTLERGPVEYDYDDLEIVLYSACEDQRANDLGILPDTAQDLYSAVYISAHFIRPCSEVNINVPEQNFVVFPDPLTVGNDDIRRITVSGYDTTETNFKLIRLQYRRTNGDGAWLNILPQAGTTHEIYNGNWFDYDNLPNPKPPKLQPQFTHFFWDTEGLADGDYEIRAVAECTGDVSNRPGFSEVIKGKIDREAPALLGVPQPSDGVFNVGDEISFSFNQPINCNKIIQADIVNPNNVGLYNAETNVLIDAHISCRDNKIIIDPNFQNEIFENKILRIEVHDIEDLTGNKNEYEFWEFYVDRNELAWLTDSIELVKYEDENKSITAKIQNRGGYPVSYNLQSLPSWIHAYPTTGTLTPNEIDEIVFTMSNDALLGEYSDSIILHTLTGVNPFFMGGDEVLNLSARVICRPPVWVISPEEFDNSSYNFSMNMIVKLNIEGVLSIDDQDIVGAYINNELRGVARVTFRAGIGYVAFLTVYSNSVSGETINFQIWDASECELYANILETFPFAENTLIGSLNTPMILNTNEEILRKIYLHPGWNWISANLDLTNPAINPTLQTLTHPQGATIKSQSTFSQYSTNLAQWVGTLTSVSPLQMYQYKGVMDDSLSITGTHLPSQSIPINVGWNWIGYLPNKRMNVNTALSSLTSTNGDIIKSQLEFAVYSSTLGWVGNLTHMSAPNGYLLKSATNGSLLYPNNGSFRMSLDKEINASTDRTKTDVDLKSPSMLPYDYWEVNPNGYEYTMNLVAIVEADGQNILSDGDEIAAFVHNEVRGSGKVVYLPAIHSYMLFLTIYANNDSEAMYFKMYDASSGSTLLLEETFLFGINQVRGSVDEPEVLHILSTSTVDDLNAQPFKTFPNPFSNMVNLSFSAESSSFGSWQVKDALGRIVYEKEQEWQTGSNTISWEPNQNIATGTYLISVIHSEGSLSTKVLYIK